MATHYLQVKYIMCEMESGESFFYIWAKAVFSLHLSDSH